MTNKKFTIEIKFDDNKVTYNDIAKQLFKMNVDFVDILKVEKQD
jgi:peptide methionine sulfoxide reductase MsrA